MPDRPISKVIKDKGVVTAPLDLTVEDAARLLKEKHVGAVLVCEGKSLVGICTERDIVFDVVAAGLDPAKTPVSKVMTGDPLTISPDKPFSHALHIMFEGGFRHVPVVGPAGEPVGLVSARDALGLDVLQFEQELILREGISEVL